MQLPKDILKNTEAALALLSGALGLLGLLLCLAFLVSSLLFTQSLEKAVVPQLDVAMASVSDFEQTMGYAAGGADSGRAAIANLSAAFASYANSSSDLSDTLSGISAIPLIGSDPKISSAAAKMREASAQFAGASGSLNSSAASASSAAASLRKAGQDIGSARQSIADAREALRSAFGALYLSEAALSLSLAALFGSVCLLSASVLLSHYPRLFDGKNAQDEGGKKTKSG
jgi:hypothetical protein